MMILLRFRQVYEAYQDFYEDGLKNEGQKTKRPFGSAIFLCVTRHNPSPRCVVTAA
jgi:hypothetical protein